MKKIVATVLIATVFSVVSASAQPPMRGKLDKKTIMDSLKVSDAIADSVIAIRDQSMTQIRSIMSDESVAREDKREKAKPVMQEMKGRLEKVLSADQMAKLQEMESNMRRNRPGKRDGK